MTSFSKAPKTYPEQLQILQDRGLEAPDPAFALHCLEHLNYYRLSIYWRPLLLPRDPAKPDEPRKFRLGTTFGDIWKLYDFDQTLRRLVIDGSKRVEVSVRSRWAYFVAHKYGPHGHETPAHFWDAAKHQELLDSLDKDLDRSHEDFVAHFRTKYGLPRPPVWAACEVFSFGLTSRYYNNLNSRQDRQDIARAYRVDEAVLRSYLHHLTIVRNHAAHHGRLWDRKFGNKQFKLPNYPRDLKVNFSAEPDSELKIYNTLTMLIYMLSVIEPGCPIPCFLYQNLDQADPSYHGQMGFPADWKNRALWQALAPPPSPAPTTSTTGGAVQ